MSSERGGRLGGVAGAVVWVWLCAFGAASADTAAGVAAYHRGDYATAVAEFRPEAERGDGLAQYSLGVIFYHGRGVQQNFEAARRYYSMAAQGGRADAQVNLAIMLFHGEGGPRDLVSAYMWLTLSEAQGNANAREAKAQLRGALTAEEIRMAEARALEWEPR